VLFRQFVDEDLGCASYLVGDEAAGVAVVVDPSLAIEQYVVEAWRRDVRLVRALETHTHADHVSGHGRLALEHDVPAAIHRDAAAEYPHETLADCDSIELGEVLVTVLHTPGHRPEHCAFAVSDRSRADEPWLVLTGDSLFVGDAGRPDLAVDAREGARGLFRSLRRLLELSDGVEVHPGHVAGSLCGRAMSSKASSTIGFERRFNELLGLDRPEDFVLASTGTVAVRPPNVERIVALNRGPFVGAPSAPGPASADDGAVVLDVRPARTFAEGHARGALNVPLEPSGFGTRAGFVLCSEERVVIHASSRAQAELAARRLNAVGFLDLAGYVVDPPLAERYEPVDVGELEHLVDEGLVEVLDVREPEEHDGGYIPGSRHIPYRLLRACADDMPDDRTVVTICEGGTRAAIAASLLAARGVDARPVLEGGIPAWQARGRNLVSFRRCGR
jgi:glyoxylase-like metal-dependent hydrolase (beta-lactamase superfamily II)/rhodanese-related sulfurtransferase